MDKLQSEISTDESVISTTEKRTLSEVLHNGKRSGGNYGSLAKSQVQPTFYICHKVELGDTLQRLSLKYSINIQEIKRVNKLWSDSELYLREDIYIPVNSTQLSTLRTTYPTLDIVQNLSIKKQSSTNNETTSSDSSISIPPMTTTNNSFYQDYFSKIDQQIRSSKQSLQSLDIPKPQTTSHNSNDDESNNRITNGRHKGVHHLPDNSAYVNITANNSRDKHILTALERLQREKDNFDEL